MPVNWFSSCDRREYEKLSSYIRLEDVKRHKRAVVQLQVMRTVVDTFGRQTPPYTLLRMLCVYGRLIATVPVPRLVVLVESGRVTFQ